MREEGRVIISQENVPIYSAPIGTVDPADLFLYFSDYFQDNEDFIMHLVNISIPNTREERLNYNNNYMNYLRDKCDENKKKLIIGHAYKFIQKGDCDEVSTETYDIFYGLNYVDTKTSELELVNTLPGLTFEIKERIQGGQELEEYILKGRGVLFVKKVYDKSITLITEEDK